MSGKLYRKVKNRYVEVGDENMESYLDNCKMYGAHLVVNTKDSKSYRSISIDNAMEVNEKILQNFKLCAANMVVSSLIYERIYKEMLRDNVKREQFDNMTMKEFMEYVMNKERLTFPSNCKLIEIIITALYEFDSDLYTDKILGENNK